MTYTQRILNQLKRSPSKYVWDDIRVAPGQWTLPVPAAPNLTTWIVDSVTYYVYEFADADYVAFSTQIPHWWVPDTPLRPHVHWTPRGFGSAESGHTVGWTVEFTIQKVTGVFEDSYTRVLTGACSGVNNKHEIAYGTGNTEDVQVVTKNKGYKASSMIVGVISRDGGSWNSALADEQPVLLELDFHAQKDPSALGTYFEYHHLTDYYKKQYGIEA